MDKEIIALLKSSDVRKRKRGMEQLMISNDPDTMKILAALYKKDPDSEIRQLAKQYAKDLQSRNTSSTNTSDVPKRKSKANPKRGKAFLESAMNSLIKGDDYAARDYARQAFMADPALEDDDYALGLASELTGVDNTQAVAALMQMADEEKPKRKRKRDDGEDLEKASWGAALLRVGIYGFISGAIVAGLMIAFTPALIAVMTAMDSTGELAAAGIDIAALSTGITAAAIIYGLLIMISAMIGYMFQMAVIHLSSTMILGGDGYYTNLLKNTFAPLMFNLVVSIVTVAVMFFFISSGLPSELVVDQAELTGDYSALEPVFGQLGLIGVLNAVIGLGVLFWISNRIGFTYDFGTGKGCLSIIVSTILMGVVSFGCSFFFTFLLGTAFSQAGF